MTRIRRIPSGRGHRYELDGEPCDGVTTVINDGLPKPALVDWAARTVATVATDRWQELSELGVGQRYRELERAHRTERDAQAVRGTAIHQLAYELAAGNEIDVPEHLVAHVDQYLRCIKDFGIVEILTETVVCNYRWKYAGTLDLIAKLSDGMTWLLDWKTGASGIWPETALQLNAYANADVYVDSYADDVELPLPQIDRAGAIWLRADGFDLYPVPLTDAVFKTFLYAQQVAHFARDAKANRTNYIGEALNEL